MIEDYSLGYREAEACAAGIAIAGLRDAIEGFEEARERVWRDAIALIGDENLCDRRR